MARELGLQGQSKTRLNSADAHVLSPTEALNSEAGVVLGLFACKMGVSIAL